VARRGLSTGEGVLPVDLPKSGRNGISCRPMLVVVIALTVAREFGNNAPRYERTGTFVDVEGSYKIAGAAVIVY
jgi:hypothetical protein